MGEKYNYLFMCSLSAMQWAILERIGRGRRQGQLSMGGKGSSLQFTKENAKTLYYHMKKLRKEGLIRKQVFSTKVKGQTNNVRKNKNQKL